MTRTDQLDFLVLLLHATPSCKKVDFSLPAEQCSRAIAAANTPDALDDAVRAYDRTRATVLLGIMKQLPKREALTIATAFYAHVDFMRAEHDAPERAS